MRALPERPPCSRTGRPVGSPGWRPADFPIAMANERYGEAARDRSSSGPGVWGEAERTLAHRAAANEGGNPDRAGHRDGRPVGVGRRAAAAQRAASSMSDRTTDTA